MGRDPQTGERKVAMRTFRGTKRAAEAELARLVTDFNEAKWVEPTKMTVAELLQRWLDTSARMNSSAKTLERYGELIENHLISILGEHRLQKLEPLHIQAAYSNLLTNGRKKSAGGLSARTVHHVHAVLYRALKQAVAWKLVANNPAASVTRPKPTDTEITFLDDEQVGILLKAASSTRLFVSVLLAVTTGLRRGEVLGLRWRDLQFDQGTLNVAQALGQTKAGLAFKAPKTKRSRRVVTLPAVTIVALRYHRATQAAERLALGLGKDDNDLVFTNILGEPMNPRAFSKEFSRIVKRAGLPPVSFHGLRHTHITALLRAGVHPKIASERAGHASVAITMDVYSHALPSMQGDLTKGLDASIRRALER